MASRTLRACWLASAVFLVAAALAGWRRVGGRGGRTELSGHYFRPQSKVYRDPGGYSRQTGRYPVDRVALADYLSHQPDSNLRSLQQRRGRVGTKAGSAESAEQWGGWKRRSGATGAGEALAQYLQHQSRKRQQVLALIKDGELRHRSRIENLARSILGTVRRKSSAEASSLGDQGETGTSSPGVMRVLGTLQSEINLDTEAISAFRDELASMIKKEGGGSAQFDEKLKTQIDAMQENNRRLATKITKFVGPGQATARPAVHPKTVGSLAQPETHQ